MSDLPKDWENKSRAELIDVYVDQLQTMSLSADKFHPLRLKPLLGGAFGNGQFALASHGYVLGGLDYVDYYVMDAASRFVLSSSADRMEAIQSARAVLTEILQPARLAVACGKCSVAIKAARAQREAAQQVAWAARRDAVRASVSTATVKSISRRKKKIFDESGGKCHYCETVLTLDGRWHIEHKMPKALGGDNAPGNLVASCAPCNHEKRDTTDQEYLAKRAAKGAKA
jgi:5-methylcytosine-specific restriction endonuclease McrA